MHSSARENYLSTQVMTAPPQKLHLMLIEAAIRFSELTRQQWQAEQFEEGLESLLRAQKIVTEMLTSLNREAAPSLVGKMASVYLFIFRSLMEASLSRSQEKLGDAIRVLHEEQITWHELCLKLADEPAGHVPSLDSARLDLGESAPGAPSPLPLTTVSLDDDSLSAGGFSLEV